jgi:hypothetical protein
MGLTAEPGAVINYRLTQSVSRGYGPLPVCLGERSNAQIPSFWQSIDHVP